MVMNDSERKTKRETVAVICPGRGTYTKNELGYLKKHKNAISKWLPALDGRLRDLGQPTVSELDGAEKFSLQTHTPGEFASTLIYACSFADFLAIDRERFEIVCVTGNSMGWYTALSVAGALDDKSSFEVIHTMGSMMRDGIIGGQVIYPTVGPDWLADEHKIKDLNDLLLKSKANSESLLFPSIYFGGYVILGGNKAGLDLAMSELPQVEEGRYPLRLVNHAAFHTPLMEKVAARGQTLLGSELFQAPQLPLVDGRGVIWQPYSTDIEALREYTLGHQVVKPYDFTSAVEVTLKEFAPDRLILLGPGSTSGGAIGQILVKNQWWGLKDKDSFSKRQEQDPVLLALGRPDQYGLVCKK